LPPPDTLDLAVTEHDFRNRPGNQRRMKSRCASLVATSQGHDVVVELLGILAGSIALLTGVED
jgi:hypothetical protein